MEERPAPGKPPTVGELHRELREHARLVERLRARRQMNPWLAHVLAEADALPLPEVDGLPTSTTVLLPRPVTPALPPCTVRRTAASPQTASRARRGGGSPGRCAECWAGCGHHVGQGADAKFYGFAADVFLAAGEDISERAVRAVVERWQARAGMTAEPQKSHLPSSTASRSHGRPSINLRGRAWLFLRRRRWRSTSDWRDGSVSFTRPTSRHSRTPTTCGASWAGPDSTGAGAGPRHGTA